MIQQQSNSRGSHVPKRFRQRQIQHHHINGVNVKWQQLQNNLYVNPNEDKYISAATGGRLYTWDKKCRADGLRGVLCEFSSVLLDGRGLKGSCRSNRTWASPTHNAKNLLRIERLLWQIHIIHVRTCLVCIF